LNSSLSDDSVSGGNDSFKFIGYCGLLRLRSVCCWF